MLGERSGDNVPPEKKKLLLAKGGSDKPRVIVRQNVNGTLTFGKPVKSGPEGSAPPVLAKKGSDKPAVKKERLIVPEIIPKGGGGGLL